MYIFLFNLGKISDVYYCMTEILNFINCLVGKNTYHRGLKHLWNSQEILRFALTIAPGSPFNLFNMLHIKVNYKTIIVLLHTVHAVTYCCTLSVGWDVYKSVYIFDFKKYMFGTYTSTYTWDLRTPHTL